MAYDKWTTWKIDWDNKEHSIADFATHVLVGI